MEELGESKNSVSAAARSLSMAGRRKLFAAFDGMMQYKNTAGIAWDISDKPFLGMVVTNGNIEFKKIDPIDSRLLAILKFFSLEPKSIREFFIMRYLDWLTELYKQQENDRTQDALSGTKRALRWKMTINYDDIKNMRHNIWQIEDDIKKNSPLMNAIMDGDVTTVRRLIQKNGSLATPEHIRFARELSPATRYTDIIKLLS
jgi:hypothetical protein